MRRSSLPSRRFGSLLAALAGVVLIEGCGSNVSSPDVGVSQVKPAVVCGTQLTTSVAVTGSGFAPLTVHSLVDDTHLQLPSVILNESASYGGTVDKSDITVYDGADQLHVRWQSDTAMSFDVYPGMRVSDAKGTAGKDLDFGLYDVSIQNPDMRRATLTGSLAVVQPPQISMVVPNPSCNAQASASYTITGDHFLQIGSDLPTVTFTSVATQAAAMVMPTVTLTDCTQLAAPVGVAMLQSCRTLTVSVPQGALAPDEYRIIVTNPDSANCASVEDPNNVAADRTVVIPPPTVTSATTLAVCSQTDSTLQITGTNFLALANPPATPMVTISGMKFTTTVDPASCTAIPDAPNGQLCTSLSFTVPMNALPVGSYQATLTNPGDDACSVAMSLQIDVVGPPTLSAVNPTTMCTGGGLLNLTGTNIYSGAVAQLVQGTSVFSSTSFSGSGTMGQALFSGPIPVTTVGMLDDVLLQNAPGCSAKLPAAEAISPGPSILFVDPPVVPNQISIQATVYASGISGQIKQIQVFPAGSTTPVLTFTTTSNPPLVLDPVFANRAYIPLQKYIAGTQGLPAGKYDLSLNDTLSTCSAFLPGALTVVSTPKLTVTSATPAFGSAGLDTAVVLAGAGFVSTPRAYLSPSSGTGNAQALAAVTYTSATSLNAVVRSGLNTGQYDLVIVNPDGSFGIASKAFTVTPANAPPPVITSIAPSSVVQATATSAVVNGSGFRTGATLGLTCYDNMGATVTGSSASVISVAGTGLSLNATITAGGTATYCIARVTNQDGTYFDFSAVGVTNASLNLTGFKAGASLTTARRALAAVAGRPTAVARFVYAIGGDNGQDNAPKSSVEAAPTSLNGTLGSFFVLSQPLPKALSFLGATVIGRFIYAVGGFDGTAATKGVYRAEILNPLNATQFSDANITFDPTKGLGGGIYTYRIAVVLGNADANNPSGETLAGDFFPIQLPVLANGKLQVQLFWPGATGAASYKIYRSPAANAAAGTEKLLATVTHNAGMTTQTFTDDGTVTPGGASPLPVGSTGTWAAMPSLGTARIGASIAAAQDPTVANQWYLYALGGNSGTVASPTALDTGELLPITITNSGTVQTQTAGTWIVTVNKQSKARWLAAGLPATSANNSVVTPATATFLYVASGSSTSVTTLDKTVESSQLPTGGQPAAFTGAGTVGIQRPGYGGALVNNQLMAFGGFQAGMASTNSDSATLSSPTTLSNFNSLGGGSLGQPRALQGTALESAFIYQLGGANAGVNTAQDTTEQTIW